jgi:RNA polymerase sigma-70 factor (ECF subfamily)
MTEELSFDSLMVRLRSGDQAAAAEIYRLFTHRLIALARTHLHRRLRGKVDPEDVLQSVYRSFFIRQANSQFEIRNWDGLWGLLATITLRKCGHCLEHFEAGCRDVRREEPRRSAADDSSASWEAIARDPTPSEAVVLAETLEEVMRGLTDSHRQMIQLSLQGYSAAEISAEVGYTIRTVQRVLERVRRRLEKIRAEGLPSVE